ncbi:MAG: nucleotidyltransferase domain-containing protein, partial [Phycisphaeraceae bacterium]|nr:nucleotidyltransferase domain-containing protein [Phycisphaeraceae bacterium]
MQDEINNIIDNIEAEEDVRILYACESGSRAWGFHSSDSDYDVRFIYVRRPEWYLSIDIASKRDVIELPVDEVLDVNGWDLNKALQLFQKTNPPLYEWLGSPIVYRDRLGLAEALRDLAPTFYCDKAAGYHYLRMAQNNHRAYLKRNQIATKKY